MSLRFFFHVVLHQVYALVQPTSALEWRTIYPDGSPTRFANLHMYARLAPNQGKPETECGIVPVQEAMFTSFMREIPLQEAAQADLHLVQYAQRIAECPSLPRLLSQIPRWTKLFLVECCSTDSGYLFDVYRVQGPEEKMVYLTPLLASALPSCEFEERPCLLVPFRGYTYQEAGSFLVQAIEVCLWGTRAHAPAYAYEVAC